MKVSAGAFTHQIFYCLMLRGREKKLPNQPLNQSRVISVSPPRWRDDTDKSKQVGQAAE